jgi:hypothetical protein
MNRLQLLQQVVDQVPPYVWRDYAGVDSHACVGTDPSRG